MRSGWRCVLGVVVLVVVAAGAALAWVLSGLPDVSARRPEGGLMDRVLGEVSDRSVKRHARGLRVPPLDDPDQVRTGYAHYRGMCAECHGGPEVEPEELARGLNPSPPPLVEEAGEWKPAELFWFTKNGVRMTGMPAWGPTHSDAEIWAVVAFLRRLPDLTAEEYRALDAAVSPLEEEEGAGGTEQEGDSHSGHTHE